MADAGETILDVTGAARALGATPDISAMLQKREAVLEPLRRSRAAKEEELAQFEGEKAKRKVEQDLLVTTEQEAALGEKIKSIEESKERQAVKDIAEKAKGAAFIPTQDNAQSLATVFALVNIAGFSLGAGGKRNSIGAMSAMNGMLEGYRKGRADLYVKEKDIFEKNVKALQTQYNMLREELADFTKRADLTYSQKVSGARLAALKNQQTFMAQYIDKVGLPQAIKRIDEQIGNINKVADFIDRENIKAEERIRQAKIRAEERQFQRKLAAETAARRMTVGKKQLMQGSDGKMYAYDPDTQQFSPVALPAGVESVTKPGSRAGQNALTFASRVYGNIENASTDLRNIIALPATSQLPVLSGLLNVERDTALGSIESLVARKITNAENRAFQQVSDQLGAALSRLEAQGLASGATKANIAAFNSLRPAAGDNAINMAIYLARVKQEIETGIRVHNKMPGATPEQKAATQVILNGLNDVVPFTVEDTLDVLRKKKQPLSDKMGQLIQQRPVADSLNIGLQQPPTQAAAPSAQQQSTTVRKERARTGEQVFTDAAGNKAVKRNNQWVEVE